MGQERAEELHEKTKTFILRRTNDLINKYLPTKHELVIFCRLTSEQKDVYTAVTDLLIEKEILKTNVMPLAIITALKKICNHPNLFLIEKSNLIDELKSSDFFIKKKSYESFDYSVKMNVVRALLRELKNTSENLVLASYFTKTLDLLEKLCNLEGLSFCRLDGSTATSGRTKIVDKFNSKGNMTREKNILLNYFNV